MQAQEQNANSIWRFRRLSVHEEWPQCFICREHVPTGFKFQSSDRQPQCLVIINVCDDCLNTATNLNLM